MWLWLLGIIAASPLAMMAEPAAELNNTAQRNGIVGGLHANHQGTSSDVVEAQLMSSLQKALSSSRSGNASAQRKHIETVMSQLETALLPDTRPTEVLRSWLGPSIADARWVSETPMQLRGTAANAVLAAGVKAHGSRRGAGDRANGFAVFALLLLVLLLVVMCAAFVAFGVGRTRCDTAAISKHRADAGAPTIAQSMMPTPSATLELPSTRLIVRGAATGAKETSERL
mmetsp:Transcript_83845/g.233934  ORF Transcript_83845/g.233934 Transcript_83845/m.233934 type:complete len:229 (+) Transcript_83845:94-780(+)